jgi:SpoIVB peptidase S55
MNMRRSGRRVRRLLAVLAITSLIASLGATPAAGQATDCPTVMPVSEVTAGMTGTGYTVSQGTDPDPFDAEILGIYPDAILPGRDLVIAEVHSPAIDAVGGVWYGMSGSPVYVDGDLVGAVAWGFSFGPSHVIGLTAAEDMQELLSYGTGDAGSALPTRVKLTDNMQKSVTAATGFSDSATPDSLVQLKMPVSVSGGGGKQLKRLQRRLNRQGYSVRLYGGASKDAAATADASDIVAGGNFAAALSYGDLTFAGIGTTTFVCDGFAVAFGHPFTFEGKTTLGANTANAITIYPDPVFSPFKLATVGGNVGAVDQDRIAGIRADLSQPLDTIPVTSTTTAENTGRTQEGRTDIVLSEWVSYLAPYHLELQIISAMDQYGEGSGETSWTLTGTRADGSPWEVSRSNMFSSRWGISYEMTHELWHMLDRIYYQDYEDIEFTGLTFDDVVARDEVRQYKVGKVLISKNDGPYVKDNDIKAKPGATLDLKVHLNPYDETLDQKVVKLSVRIPKKTRRNAELRIFGGPGHHPGFVGKASSLDDLLDKIADDPPNNRVAAQLRTRHQVKSQDSKLRDTVIVGSREIDVHLKDR